VVVVAVALAAPGIKRKVVVAAVVLSGYLPMSSLSPEGAIPIL